ncbi:MAG: hypothetical protein KDB26_11925 [Microthrixaceae bacterium]|nr:hypothetical protein [Microthrixaceae bacterium]
MTENILDAKSDLFVRAYYGGGVVYTNGAVPRIHYAATESGGTEDKPHKKLMREWYGLKPVSGHAWYTWALCPHRLVGMKCESQRGAYGRCPIYYSHGYPAYDHPRAWRDGDGNLVITLEPWGNPFAQHDELTTLATDLNGIGVAMAYEGRSPYGASYVLFLANAETRMGAVMTTRGGFNSVLDAELALNHVQEN